jgi:uncharacterized phiE125 gp8 family phage protein
MIGTIRQITPPESLPVTIEQLADHARADCHAESAYLEVLIQAARDYVEMFTRRQLINATWRLTLDEFPSTRDPIRLPRPPLVSVSSIKYIDTDGVEQTIDAADYIVDADSEPPRITPKHDGRWPTSRTRIAAVKVEYVSGYGTSHEDIPASLRNALLMLAGHWYVNRESVVIGTIATNVPQSAEALMWGDRVMEAV